MMRDDGVIAVLGLIEKHVRAIFASWMIGCGHPQLGRLPVDPLEMHTQGLFPESFLSRDIFQHTNPVQPVLKFWAKIRTRFVPEVNVLQPKFTFCLFQSNVSSGYKTSWWMTHKHTQREAKMIRKLFWSWKNRSPDVLFLTFFFLDWPWSGWLRIFTSTFRFGSRKNFNSV